MRGWWGTRGKGGGEDEKVEGCVCVCVCACVGDVSFIFGWTAIDMWTHEMGLGGLRSIVPFHHSITAGCVCHLSDKQHSPVSATLRSLDLTGTTHTQTHSHTVIFCRREDAEKRTLVLL